jgi:hypothetical protein
MMVGGDRNISYRAKATTSASATVSKPSGVAKDDLVFVLVPNSTAANAMSTASGAAWTQINLTGTTGMVSRVFWKKLAALDLTNAWELNGAEDALAVRYQANGATTVTSKSTTTNGAGQTTLDLATFTPAASRGVIAIAVDTDTGATVTEPTNFVSRDRSNVNAGAKSNFADRVSGYAGGTVTFTNTNGGGAEHGFLLDVT